MTTRQSHPSNEKFGAISKEFIAFHGKGDTKNMQKLIESAPEMFETKAGSFDIPGVARGYRVSPENGREIAEMLLQRAESRGSDVSASYRHTFLIKELAWAEERKSPDSQPIVVSIQHTNSGNGIDHDSDYWTIIRVFEMGAAVGPLINIECLDRSTSIWMTDEEALIRRNPSA